jgi:putative NADH-flavin reductase
MTTTPHRMHVTVFGATGKIGRLVVDQLLADGHTVTAYVRNPAKLTAQHPNLHIVQGELDDASAVARAVEGADAVISALGPSLRRGTTGTPVADGTRNIVNAMQAAGIRRYIGLATPAMADEHDRPTLKGKILRLMPRLAMPNALREIDAMGAAITGADFDWTIARITNPTHKPAKGTVRAGYLGHDRIGSAMTRADIAAFLVGQLTDTTYLRAAPAISN